MADSKRFQERLRLFIDHNAADRVHSYFFGSYTGARFDRLCGGGDRPQTLNSFTADDLVRRGEQVLVGQLEMTRSQSVIGDDISRLRVFDLAVWMGHRHAL